MLFGANSSRPTGSFPWRQKAPAVESETIPALKTKKTGKSIDGCRSLIHAKRALRRYAPI